MPRDETRELVALLLRECQRLRRKIAELTEERDDAQASASRHYLAALENNGYGP